MTTCGGKRILVTSMHVYLHLHFIMKIFDPIHCNHAFCKYETSKHIINRTFLWKGCKIIGLHVEFTNIILVAIQYINSFVNIFLLTQYPVLFSITLGWNRRFFSSNGIYHQICNNAVVERIIWLIWWYDLNENYDTE